MTAPDGPTLTDVRDRFLEAEGSLRAVAESMRKLEHYGASIDAARSSVSSATSDLREFTKVAGAASQALLDGVELVRRALATLERSQPEAVLARLEQMATGASVHELRAVTGDVSAASTEAARKLESLQTEVGARYEAALAHLREQEIAIQKRLTGLAEALNAQHERATDELRLLQQRLESHHVDGSNDRKRLLWTYLGLTVIVVVLQAWLIAR